MRTESSRYDSKVKGKSSSGRSEEEGEDMMRNAWRAIARRQAAQGGGHGN
jgi:hypothetical protein